MFDPFQRDFPIDILGRSHSDHEPVSGSPDFAITLPPLQEDTYTTNSDALKGT